jgi:hypothetical protein
MPAHSGRLRAFKLTLGTLLCTLSFSISCASLRLPVELPNYEAAQLLTLSIEGVNVFAKPLISRRDYQDIFDDYLPEIGLVAVWVQVQNARSPDITLADNRWLLRIGKHNARQLDAPSILKHYYRERNIRMYTLGSYTRSREKIEKLLIPDGEISTLMALEGFAIFAVDKSLQKDWNKGAVLMNKSIYLDNRKKVEIRLSLDYANH